MWKPVEKEDFLARCKWSKLTPGTAETLKILDYHEGTRKIIKELPLIKSPEPDGYRAGP